jgi:hypothetical protein
MLESLKEKLGFNRRRADKEERLRLAAEANLRHAVKTLITDDYVYDRIRGIQNIKDPSISYMHRDNGHFAEHIMSFDRPTYSLDYITIVTFDHGCPNNHISVIYFDKVNRDMIVLVTRRMTLIPPELRPNNGLGYLQHPFWLVNDIRWFQLLMDVETEYQEKVMEFERAHEQNEIELMVAQRRQALSVQSELNQKEKRMLDNLPTKGYK